MCLGQQVCSLWERLEPAGFHPRLRGTMQLPGCPPLLLRQFLAWVAARPRTYRETMDAWRTSCPRMPAWEDATSMGLVEVVSRAGMITL